jgi:hypothetical protein
MRSGLPAQLNFLPEPTENGYFFANSRAFQYRVAHGLTVAVNHSVSYHQGEISGLNVAGADLRFQVAQGFREVAPRAAASLRVISQLFEHALVAEVVKYRGARKCRLDSNHTSLRSGPFCARLYYTRRKVQRASFRQVAIMNRPGNPGDNYR